MTTIESVKVVVRCRALNRRELSDGDDQKKSQNQIVVRFQPDLNQVSVISQHQTSHHQLDNNNGLPSLFTFDAVYGLDSTTEQIYNEVAFPIVESAFEGYNGTIFAYGQTGCGKSFTMQGSLTSADNHVVIGDNKNKNQGIIQRAFEHILEAVAATKDFKFLLRTSYIEIYNDEIHDLLAPTNNTSNNQKQNNCHNKLDLKRGIIDIDTVDHSGVVDGLTIMNVQTLDDCCKVVMMGLKNRSVSATLMNSDSSRSHSILTIYIERIRYASSDATSIADQHAYVRRGKLHLVDLAGSERLSRTGAAGDRLKEATKINLSLSALSNVISSVADHAHHIPYRDSKLTRLLQDSLGGNAKTLMIACIAPTMADYSETLCTLSFARRAKNIKNKPVINQSAKDSILENYKIEIDRLRALLADLEARQQKKRSVDMGHSSNLKILNDTMSRPQNQVRNINGQDSNDLQLSDDENLEQCQSLDQMRINAMERLNKLQSQLVGGERADDEDIKMKRNMRARMAKKKFDALSSALAQLNDNDQKLVKAFGNVSEELASKKDILKSAELRIASLEQEIGELTREFELDRSDMASKIYKQSKEIKFFKQLAEFIFNCAINYDYEYFINFNRSHHINSPMNSSNTTTTTTTQNNNSNHNNQIEAPSQKSRLRTTKRGQQQHRSGSKGSHSETSAGDKLDREDSEEMSAELAVSSQKLVWSNGRASLSSLSSLSSSSSSSSSPSSFYSFVQFIRKQSNWSEFEHKWLLPDAQKLQITSDRLPNTISKFKNNYQKSTIENDNSHQQKQQVTDNPSSSKLWQKIQNRNSKESLIAYFNLNRTAHLLNGQR